MARLFELFFLYLQQDFPAELCMHLAVGSSLATVVFTSVISAMAHHRHGAVQWRVVGRLGPGIELESHKVQP